MKKFAVKFSMALLLTAPFHSQAQENTPYSKVYSTGVEDVFNEAMTLSKEVKSLEYSLESANESLDSAEGYFYPKFTTTTEFKNFYGEPEPDPEQTGEVALNISSKLYSNTVSDSIDAAEATRNAAILKIKDKEVDVYYTVLKALAKIERSRFYIYEMSLLRKEMRDYIERQKTSVKEGVSPISDLKESELNLSRFDNAVLDVSSSIDQAFSDLKLATGYVPNDPDEVGMPIQTLKKLIESQKMEFKAEDILLQNYGIRAQELEVLTAMFDAQALNENYKLSLVNETFVNALERTDVPVGEISSRSNVGLKFELELYDYQKNRDASAAMKDYLAQKESLSLAKDKLEANVSSLQTSYYSLLDKRASTIEQIRLNRSLIQNQKKEVITNRITFLDLIKSIFAFNTAYKSLLDIEVQTYDNIFDYWALKSEKIY